MTVRTKLMSLVAAAGAVTIVVGFSGHQTLTGLSTDSNEIINRELLGPLEEIERSVESATESVTAISASANEQAQATQDITREAERLAETSDGVERSTTELRRSVERLAGADLDRLLGRFTTRSASPAGSVAGAGDPEA